MFKNVGISKHLKYILFIHPFMSWKRQKIAMPTTMAGILGLSPDEEVGGIKIEPKTFLVATLIFIFIIKVLHYALDFLPNK